LELVLVKLFAEHGFRTPEAGSAGDVGEDDVLVFELWEDLGELLEVGVFADLGALAVCGVEEGALGDEDLGVLDVGVVVDSADGGVAEEGDEGDFGAVLDLDALFAEGGEFDTWSADVFGLEFFADGDEGVAEAGAAVVGFDAADEEVASDGVVLGGEEGDELVGGSLAFDIAPAAEHGVDRLVEFGGDDDGAGFHALEMSLGEVVGKAGHVVHVAVGDADDIAGEGEVGSAADVEADVEFGDLDDGFLAGDGVSDDVDGSEADLGELLDEEGLFHEVGRVTGGGVQGKRICAFGR